VSTRRPSLKREAALWVEGRSTVAGIDEVGRGPLAGPVVAAAVVFPMGAKPIRGLDDSKVLTHLQRLKFAAKIRERAFAIGVGAASVREIDRLNIRRASILAMERALVRLRFVPAWVLIDGLPCPELGREHEAIVDGDARCHSIAAASVIAKILRDALMDRLAARHPGYSWESNKGYATPEHLDAINRLGPTRHHRFSFAPVAQIDLLATASPAPPSPAT
jgi:ribonuclease HII